MSAVVSKAPTDNGRAVRRSSGSAFRQQDADPAAPPPPPPDRRAAASAVASGLMRTHSGGSCRTDRLRESCAGLAPRGLRPGLTAALPNPRDRGSAHRSCGIPSPLASLRSLSAGTKSSDRIIAPVSSLGPHGFTASQDSSQFHGAAASGDGPGLRGPASHKGRAAADRDCLAALVQPLMLELDDRRHRTATCCCRLLPDDDRAGTRIVSPWNTGFGNAHVAHAEIGDRRARESSRRRSCRSPAPE